MCILVLWCLFCSFHFCCKSYLLIACLTLCVYRSGQDPGHDGQLQLHGHVVSMVRDSVSVRTQGQTNTVFQAVYLSPLPLACSCSRIPGVGTGSLLLGSCGSWCHSHRRCMEIFQPVRAKPQAHCPTAWTYCSAFPSLGFTERWHLPCGEQWSQVWSVLPPEPGVIPQACASSSEAGGIRGTNSSDRWALTNVLMPWIPIAFVSHLLSTCVLQRPPTCLPLLSIHSA